jgi:hypothetical protein
MMFEVEDLAVASPATVSRWEGGMLRAVLSQRYAAPVRIALQTHLVAAGPWLRGCLARYSPSLA